LKGLKTDEPLAPHTTFKIGGPARFFYEARSAEDIKRAVKLVRALKIRYFILGGGSNLLVSDRGFDGLAVKVENVKFKIKNLKITASAGVSLAELVDASVRAGLTGLEWAAGIPGTLGGAIRGNAGAFGGSMSDIVRRVRILRNGRLQEIGDYAFLCGYRQSPFGKTKDIILAAELRLKKGDGTVSRKIIREHLSERRSGQPADWPSAGCVFKNLPLTAKNLQRLSRQYSEIERFASKGKVPAGWLMEKCGLKGKKIGGAMISEKHANFIVNAGGAKARDVISLIKLTKFRVGKKFGLSPKEEIRYVGL